MTLSLTETDYEIAADSLGVGVAAVKAVAEVESAGSGFLPDGRVKLLFERHHFAKYTGHKYDAKYPAISSSTPGGYKSGAAEAKRFQQALSLDRKAAMLSASYGKFQIMGFNFALCGFTSVDAFVKAMNESESAHLAAFVEFVKSKGLDDELQRLDWKGFARGYNGPAYAKNAYDTKLAAAYKKHGGSETPGVELEIPEQQAPPPAVPELRIALPTQEPDAPMIKSSLVPQEAPTIATTDEKKAWWTNIAAQVGAGGGSIVALLTNNTRLVYVLVGLGAAALIGWYVRSAFLDYARMKFAADPTKFNVK